MRRDELEAFKSRINEEMSVAEGLFGAFKGGIGKTGEANANATERAAAQRQADEDKARKAEEQNQLNQLKRELDLGKAEANYNYHKNLNDFYNGLKNKVGGFVNRVGKKVGNTAQSAVQDTKKDIHNAANQAQTQAHVQDNRERPAAQPAEKKSLGQRFGDGLKNLKTNYGKLKTADREESKLQQEKEDLTNKIDARDAKFKDMSKQDYATFVEPYKTSAEKADDKNLKNVSNKIEQNQENAKAHPVLNTVAKGQNKVEDIAGQLKDNFKSKDPKQLKLDFKAAEKAEKEQQKQADEEAKKAREVKVANDGQTKLDLGGLEGKTKTIDPEKKPLMDKVKDGLKNVTDKFKKPEAEEQQSEENNNSFGADGIHKETGTKFDLNGYDANGYNQYGFNKSNFNKDGINKFTGTKFDLNGYDANGFNANGFNKDGFDANGFNKEGYNANGFNKDDIHKETGTKFDKEGYDAKGFNKEGYDIDGYDEEGRNNYGFDRNGFDEKGINRETGTEFDKEGFDVNGFNKEGINKETGTEFNTNGFDINGYDANGFNKEGYNTNGFNKEGINIETGTKFDKNGLDINGNPASSSNTSDTDDTASDTSDNSSNVNNGDNQNDNTAQQTKKGLGDKVLDAIGNAAGTFRRGTNYVGKEIPHAVKNAFNKVDDELNKKYNGAFTPQQNQQAAQQPQQQQMSPNPYLAQAQAAMAAMYNPAFPAYAMPYMMGDMNYGNYNPQVTAQTVGQGLQQNQQGTTNPTIPPNTDDTQNKTLTADDVIRIVQDTLKGNLNNKTTSDNKDYAPNAEITTSIRTKLENGESPDSFSEEENKAYEYYNQNGLIKDGKLVSDDDLAQHFTSKGITSGIIANAEKINKNNNVNNNNNNVPQQKPAVNTDDAKKNLSVSLQVSKTRPNENIEITPNSLPILQSIAAKLQKGEKVKAQTLIDNGVIGKDRGNAKSVANALLKALKNGDVLQDLSKQMEEDPNKVVLRDPFTPEERARREHGYSKNATEDEIKDMTKTKLPAGQSGPETQLHDDGYGVKGGRAQQVGKTGNGKRNYNNDNVKSILSAIAKSKDGLTKEEIQKAFEKEIKAAKRNDNKDTGFTPSEFSSLALDDLADTKGQKALLLDPETGKYTINREARPDTFRPLFGRDYYYEQDDPSNEKYVKPRTETKIEKKPVVPTITGDSNKGKVSAETMADLLSKIANGKINNIEALPHELRPAFNVAKDNGAITKDETTKLWTTKYDKVDSNEDGNLIYSTGKNSIRKHETPIQTKFNSETNTISGGLISKDGKPVTTVALNNAFKGSQGNAAKAAVEALKDLGINVEDYSGIEYNKKSGEYKLLPKEESTTETETAKNNSKEKIKSEIVEEKPVIKEPQFDSKRNVIEGGTLKKEDGSEFTVTELRKGLKDENSEAGKAIKAFLPKDKKLSDFVDIKYNKKQGEYTLQPQVVRKENGIVVSSGNKEDKKTSLGESIMALRLKQKIMNLV